MSDDEREIAEDPPAPDANTPVTQTQFKALMDTLQLERTYPRKRLVSEICFLSTYAHAHTLLHNGFFLSLHLSCHHYITKMNIIMISKKFIPSAVVVAAVASILPYLLVLLSKRTKYRDSLDYRYESSSLEQ